MSDDLMGCSQWYTENDSKAVLSEEEDEYQVKRGPVSIYMLTQRARSQVCVPH